MRVRMKLQSLLIPMMLCGCATNGVSSDDSRQSIMDQIARLTPNFFGDYDNLPTVESVPFMLELERRAEALPTRSHRTKIGELEGKPIEVASRETGTGQRERAIVLVHGIMSDSRFWRFVKGDIGSDHDVIEIDLLGCGESDAPNPKKFDKMGYSAESLGRYVLTALRDRLKDRPDSARVTLIGHSLGGMIILRTYADEQIRNEFADVLARVDGVLLFTPIDVAIEEMHPDYYDIATAPEYYWILGRAMGEIRRRVARATIAGVDDHRLAIREEADRLIEIFSDTRRRRAVQAMIRECVPWERHGAQVYPNWDEIERLVNGYQNLNVPCLILWGRRDQTFPVSMGYKLCHQIPDARLQVVRKSMHSLPVERPRICSRQIRWFLQQSKQQWSAAPRVTTISHVAETAVAERSK